jgi:hypothetical protein
MEIADTIDVLKLSVAFSHGTKQHSMVILWIKGLR